jgi:hypothetical protein
MSAVISSLDRPLDVDRRLGASRVGRTPPRRDPHDEEDEHGRDRPSRSGERERPAGKTGGPAGDRDEGEEERVSRQASVAAHGATGAVAAATTPSSIGPPARATGY